MPERVMLWRDILPGDTIRGGDGQPWLILDRGRRTVTMAGPGGTPVTGDPRPDSVVALLVPGLARDCVDLFTACGLPVKEIIHG